MFSVYENEKKINQNNDLLFSVKIIVASVCILINAPLSSCLPLHKFIPLADTAKEPLPQSRRACPALPWVSHPRLAPVRLSTAPRDSLESFLLCRCWELTPERT